MSLADLQAALGGGGPVELPCDLNHDGMVDEMERAECGGPGPGPAVPAEIEAELASLRERFAQNPGLVLPLERLGRELSEEALAFLRGIAGPDGELTLADLQAGTGGQQPVGEPCDLNHDGMVDETERAECGGPGPAVPPEIMPELNRLRERFAAAPEEVLTLARLGEELSEEALAFLRGFAGPDEEVSLADLQAALGGGGPVELPCDLNHDGMVDETERRACGGPGVLPCDANGDGLVDAVEAEECGGPGPAMPPEIMPELSRLRERFAMNPGMVLRVERLRREVSAAAVEFLATFAGPDQELNLADLEVALGSGQPSGPEALQAFEGILEGVNLAERLLIIGGQEYEVAANLRLEDAYKRTLGVGRLVELAGSYPLVGVQLDAEQRVAVLTVHDLREDAGGQPEIQAMQFYGPVGELTSSRIVLAGPRFAVTGRTRFVGPDNQEIPWSGIGGGQMVAVTVGPPSAETGSPDPTALRVQTIDPTRPPPQRTDIVTAPVVEVVGPGGADPHIQLAGPQAGLTAQTRFTNSQGQEIEAGQVGVGSTVRVDAQPAAFGSDLPVALQVALMAEGGVLEPPPVEEEEAEVAREEMHVEGSVVRVDAAQRSLALAGERLLLAAQVQVLDLAGRRVGLAQLSPGDLLEIDTRAGGARGVLVTGVRVVDPAQRVVPRPGVKIGSLEVVSDGELVLSGPFFQVARDAEIRGTGGRQIELSEVAPGEYVKLRTSPPRFERGETLPVAFDIRVVTPPQGPAEGPVEEQGQLTIVASFPEEGDIGVPVRTRVEVRFSRPVFDVFFDPSFDYGLYPAPEEFGGLEISPDGRTLSAEVRLRGDTVYQLSLVTAETGMHTVHFSTGGSISSAAISGNLVLPAELPQRARMVREQSFVLLLQVDGVDLSTLVHGSPEFEQHVVAGAPLSGHQFTFSNVEPGQYAVAAHAVFQVASDRLVELQATSREALTLGEGEQVTVDLVLELPPGLEVVSTTPAADAVGVERESELVVQFNQPALLELKDLLIFPYPGEVGALTASADQSVYALPVTLAEETGYRVVVAGARDLHGGALAHPVTFSFTTGSGAAGASTVSGRLVVPQLPAVHSFAGPVLVGLIAAERVDLGTFGFSSFSEEDVAAAAVAFGPEFTMVDVPPGQYVAVAFAQVEVPRGFRPPDPRLRPMDAFDVLGRRFAEQALEQRDTIELFGFYSGAGPGRPALVEPGQEGITIYLAGRATLRDALLRLAVVEVGDVELPLGDGEAPAVDAGETDIRLVFGRALRVDRGLVALEASLNGRVLRTPGIEDGGRTLVFRVTLEEGTYYSLSIFRAEGADGSRLERPVEVGFSTGAEEIAFATLAGTVTLESVSEDGETLTGDESDHVDAGRVFLFAQTGEAEELSLVAATEVAEDGTFLLDGVVPGQYQVFAELETASGQQLNAIHDTDGDGLADVLDIGAGEAVSGIDILATVVVASQQDEETGSTAKTAPPGGNAEAVLSLDLDGTTGNQGVTTLSNVDVGQEVNVDLYVAGAADLSGFAATVNYDADILEFVGAADAAGTEGSFLRSAGGQVMYLFPLLREPELEYGGAVLGARSTTAADGTGFLARFAFRVESEFEGAQVRVTRVKLRSVTGEDVQAPALAAKLAPPVFEEQEKGPVSFDFDTDRGDQEAFHKGFVTAGSQVEVDVYLNLDRIAAGFRDLSNYSVTVEFDPAQLSYVSYAPQTASESNLLASGGGIVPQMPPIVTETSVTFGSAILGPTTATAPDSSGLIGRLTFATTDAFTESDLLLTEYSVKGVGTAQQEVATVIIARISTGEIQPVRAGGQGGGGTGESGAGLADFDGSGGVDFGDFFLFADVFGQPGTGANAAFDLDGSGTVDFGDFFLFADVFGQSAARLAAAAGLPAGDGGLELHLSSDDRGLLLTLASGGEPLRGYGAVVEFDAAAFDVEEVSDRTSTLRQGGEALLLEQRQPGQVLLLGSATRGRGQAAGELARVRFTPLRPEALGRFRVLEAITRRSDGRVVRVSLPPGVEGRWVPQAFALHGNYPNPFNPATTISYQLAAPAPVRLEVYDVLGQRVRTLVRQVQSAGFHTVVWDSRDDQAQPVGAGVYLCRLRAGSFSQVRKLLLAK
ncbi:MAG: Ig-like domain-containing protein [Candidatus Latescibacterota bacterium]